MGRRSSNNFWSVLIPVLIGALAGASSASVASAITDAAGARQHDVHEGIQYSTFEGQPLLLDVYAPDVAQGGAEIARPAVVFVHGGRFRIGNRSWMRREALHAAELGWVAISIDYRLTETPGHPGAVSDVVSAVDWVRENADEFGIDPAHIAVYGSSAGGTLASLAAVMEPDLTETDSRISAVVSFSGVMDFTELYEETGPSGFPARTASNYLGCVPQDCAGLYEDASPVTHVSSGDPAHFIVNSTEELIPATQAIVMHDALDRVGVLNEFELVEGDLHGKALSDSGDLRDRAFEFLDMVFSLPPADAEPPSAAAPPTTVVAPPAGSTDDDAPMWVLVVGAAAVGGVLLVGLAAFRRRAHR